MRPELDYANNAFRFYCSEIRLVATSDPELSLAGPGEIWRDDGGVLNYKFFVSSGIREALIREGRDVVPGRVLPQEAYYNFEAVGFGGQAWSATHALPSITHDGRDSGVICGTLGALTTCGGELNGDFLRIWVSGHLEFPANAVESTSVHRGSQLHRVDRALSVAEVSGDNFRLQIAVDGDHTVASFRTFEGPVDGHTEMRIVESLQFVLGRPIVPLVVQSATGNSVVTRLISPYNLSGHAVAINAPVDLRAVTRGTAAWELFGRYFDYVCSYKEAAWHPVSRHIALVIEASVGSINSQVLALAVATEGIAAECLAGLGTPAQVDLEELEEAARLLDSTSELSERLRKRLTGSLNMMKAPRAADRLYEFVDRMGMPRTLVKAWSDLRNSAAHGASTTNQDIAKLVELRDAVLYLLYSIVLHTVDYQGQRVDHSAPGWPMVPQPMRSPEC